MDAAMWVVPDATASTVVMAAAVATAIAAVAMDVTAADAMAVISAAVTAESTHRRGVRSVGELWLFNGSLYQLPHYFSSSLSKIHYPREGCCSCDR